MTVGNSTKKYNRSSEIITILYSCLRKKSKTKRESHCDSLLTSFIESTRLVGNALFGFFVEEVSMSDVESNLNCVTALCF